MFLLGCKPPERNTEQHDVFFGIGYELEDLYPDIFNFWPEANKKIHLDAWRAVTNVENYKVSIMPRGQTEHRQENARLFFLNLGGYKANEFEEYHYKIVVAGKNKEEAIQKAKQTAFYKHTGFKGAASHIDEKYGVDVDELYEITDILPPAYKEKYSIVLSPAEGLEEDELYLEYIKLESYKTI